MSEILLKLLSYPRSLLATVFTLFFTASYGSIIIFSGLLFGERARRCHDFILTSWGRVVSRCFSIQLDVRGLEHLHRDGVVFVFNHSSLFDIVLFHAAVPKSTRFGAKIELYRIPIFGQIMKSMGVLPIARSDRDRVLKLYENSVDRVRRGESFVLAAEGTRQHAPGVGEKFKSGPFIFAINGQIPIQPVVIKGAYEILPKSRLLPAWGQWRNPVRVQILAPLPTAGLQVDDRERFKETVREMMTKAYAQS